MIRGKALLIALTISLLGRQGSGQAQPDAVCPRKKSTNMSVHLDTADPNGPNFKEISGLSFSPTLLGPSGKPLIYVVNDSGGGTRFGVYDSGSGRRIKSLRLPQSLKSAMDFESLVVGSCGADRKSSSCIYIADVGDNTARNSKGKRTGRKQTSYRIYKIREPDPHDFQDNAIIPQSYVTTLKFNYFHPSSPTRYSDCEAMFIDSVGWGDDAARGDLYLVSKWEPRSTNVRLFKIPAHTWTKAKADTNFVYSPRAVGDYSNSTGLQSNGISGRQWTRAEMTQDGTVIALGDYNQQYVFLRCPSMSVEQALAVIGTKDCTRWPRAYGNSQFETIAWAPDGKSMLEISECKGPCSRVNNRTVPMVVTEMRYPSGSARASSCKTARASMADAHTPATSCPSVLRGNGKLFANKKPSFLCSPNGAYRFGFNDSNELTLWRRRDSSDSKIWSAKACCAASEVSLVMQGGDANLVLHGNVNNNRQKALWSSQTGNSVHGGAQLSVEDDGQARIRFEGTVIWSTENGLTTQQQTARSPTSKTSCASFDDKVSCLGDKDCKWKGGACVVKRQAK